MHTTFLVQANSTLNPFSVTKIGWFCLFCFLNLPGILDAQNPIAWYPFDGNAKDISGNGNDGSIKGNVTPTFDRDGNPCSAMLFDGSSGYIRVPTSSSLESPKREITFTTWFSLTYEKAETYRGLSLICKGDSAKETATNPEYRMQVFQFAKESTISINSDFTENDTKFSEHPFTPGAWHFFALTYNGAQVTVYLNAEQIWSFPYTKPFDTNKLPVYIGRDVPGSTEYLAGALDELKIFNTALTASQIATEFNKPNPFQQTHVTAFNFICNPDIKLPAKGPKCEAVATWNLPQYNRFPCRNISVVQVDGKTSGSSFPVGEHTVAYALKEGNNVLEVCQFQITVEATKTFALSCQRDTTVISKEEKGVKFVYDKPKITKGCAEVDLKQTEGPASGSIFPVGVTKIAYEAKENSGKLATCEFNVTVKYDPPVAAAPKPVTADTSKPVIVASIPKMKSIQDSVVLQGVIEMKNYIYTVIAFDNEAEDGDIVSLYFNDSLIIDKLELKHFNNKKIKGSVIYLKRGQDNFLVSKAWNKGRVGKNTCTIRLYEGIIGPGQFENHRSEVFKTLNSDIGIAATIKLRYDK